MLNTIGIKLFSLICDRGSNPIKPPVILTYIKEFIQQYQDVSWRFKFLNGKDIEIYSYRKGDDFLRINSSLIKFTKS